MAGCRYQTGAGEHLAVMPLEDEDAYWRQYYGMGRPWAATPRNRTGCLVLLVGALALIVVTLLVALVAAVV